MCIDSDKLCKINCNVTSGKTRMQSGARRAEARGRDSHVIKTINGAIITRMCAQKTWIEATD